MKFSLPSLSLTNRQVLAAGMFLLGTLFFCALICGICFLCGGTVNGTVFPLAMVLAAAVCVACFGGRDTVLPVVYGLIFIAVTALFSALVYDTTFDSFGYHNDIAVMLSQGWNPVTQDPPNGSIWAKHYAKLFETAGASVMALSGNLQSIKCVNFMLLGAALAVAYYTLAEYFSRISAGWRAAIVFVIAANPVVIRQTVSVYNDYAVWLETVLLACSFVMMTGNRAGSRTHDSRTALPAALPYLLLFFTFAISINTKFTHFYYVGVECLFFAGWCAAFRRWTVLRRGVITVLAAVVAGVAIIGYNPYVLNTLHYGIPTYPLGTDAVDIMTGNTPAMFDGGNRFVNFFKSLLSVSDASWAVVNGGCTLDGIRNSYVNTMTVNGFGVLMAPMLLLGLALMVLSRPKLRWWVVYLFMLVICFSFEQSWWARYIPFLWFGIVFPLVVSLVTPATYRRLRRCLCCILVALCAVNAAVSVAATAASRLSYTAYINYIVTQQHKSGKPLLVAGVTPTMCQQLRERNVRYEEYPTVSALPDTAALFRFFGTRTFTAVVQLPAADYPRAHRPSATLLDRLIRFPSRRYRPTPAPAPTPAAPPIAERRL